LSERRDSAALWAFRTYIEQGSRPGSRDVDDGRTELPHVPIGNRMRSKRAERLWRTSLRVFLVGVRWVPLGILPHQSTVLEVHRGMLAALAVGLHFDLCPLTSTRIPAA
jgi:hypothetical protein